MRKIFTKRVFWSGLISSFLTLTIPRYITFDTEIRCVTDPCLEATGHTSLFGWLWDAQPKIIDADYYIPVFAFIIFFVIVYWIYPRIRK